MAEQLSCPTGNSKRGKLQDIVAHQGKANCVCIGTSGSLLVSGGDDAAVNVWAVGRPGVVYSLQGHTAPVTSVCYDKKEEMVLAGSQSATVKLYDLQSAKQLRTITGHRSEISALDFHPVGNWFASGSLDTNWKLWDKRQRNCTATFKGHSDSITHLYFSPPGKWVVTASADGVVKLWDLSAGKSIAELPHAQRVTAVQFNPVECVLATACKDRTIRLWDLDRFDSFDACGPETTSAHAMAFNPDGQSLFVAYNDNLRKYGFEPTETLEHREMSWAHVLDIMVANDNVISCSVSGSTVSVWAVETSASAPHKQPPADPRPSPSQPQPGHLAREPRNSAVQTSDGENRQAAPIHTTWKRGQPTELDPAMFSSSERGEVVHDHQDGHWPQFKAPAVPRDKQANVQAESTMVDAITEIGASLFRNDAPVGLSNRDAATAPAPTNGGQARSSGNGQSHQRASSPAVEIFVGRTDAANHPDLPQQTPQKSSTPGEQAPHVGAQRSPYSPQPSEPHMPADARHVGKRHQNAELPAQAQGYGAGGSASPPPDAERELADVLQHVQKQHQRFMSMMDARSSGIGIIKSFFERGDIRGCLSAAQRLGDPAFTVDVFRFLASDDRPREFRLNMCSATASAVRMCLPARPDDVVKIALSFARLVLKGFGVDIQAGCRQREQPARDPVDLKGDERRANCREAKDSFMELLPELRRVLDSSRPLAVKERAQDVAERIVGLSR